MLYIFRVYLNPKYEWTQANFVAGPIGARAFVLGGSHRLSIWIGSSFLWVHVLHVLWLVEPGTGTAQLLKLS